jgi:hypothetical protein
MRAVRLGLMCLTALTALPLVDRAVASIGTGVGAAPIELDRPAVAGHRYTLMPLYIRNTGTVRTRYVAQVRRVPPFTTARAVPRRWVRFAHRSVVLAAGEATTIALRLVVPSDARRGRYASDILVTTRGPDTGPVQIGTGAATALKFTVTSSTRRRS